MKQGRDKAFRRAVTTVSIVVVVVLAVAVATLLYLRTTPSRGGVAASLGLARGNDASHVALVIASPAADGAVVAQLVAIVDSNASQNASTAITDVDPDTKVAIPGTSFDRLRDAYAFGGGAAVVAALPKPKPELKPQPKPAYVAVPQPVWTAAVDRSRGVTVTLPASLDVFDGTRLTSFSAGEQRIQGEGIAALLMGLAHVPATDRATVRTQLERGIAASLATDAAATEAGVSSDLSRTALHGWLNGSALKSGGR